ncbi:alpha/beta fold hydrolase [Muricomes intestini]|uniref:Pimeloyl-ACP methyl ester carboxylesterase n=1 Tax=Muricomes intestini TaxID=1796634 RepID=A0A4R3K068_9FIRM|nr:alpha/beta hydrolase [Muricomes intestini]TCS75074.1 pimeloyl-ACP methyl ester carboxylesterase [Muricomes intestini]HAX53599.1 hypothetical protein [Lachnospiraceae bacterium]
MEKETMNIKANGIDFYCETRGSGPLVVLVPDGSNDCGPYDNLAKELSDQFTTLTFDMRGGTRSMDSSPQKVTPSLLGDDLAEIIRIFDKGKATIYGCSSGGQTVLSAGRRHPSLIRNVMVHEAALQADTPLPEAGFSFFENISTFDKYLTGNLNSGDFWGVCNADTAGAIDSAARARIEKNNIFWQQWYLGTVDTDSYSEEDFEKMPPVDFSVGTWTPSWLVYANLATAKRGNCPVTWFNCSHHPEISIPAEYAQYMKRVIAKYL